MPPGLPLAPCVPALFRIASCASCALVPLHPTPHALHPTTPRTAPCILRLPCLLAAVDLPALSPFSVGRPSFSLQRGLLIRDFRQQVENAARRKCAKGETCRRRRSISRLCSIPLQRARFARLGLAQLQLSVFCPSLLRPASARCFCSFLPRHLPRARGLRRPRGLLTYVYRRCKNLI